jgi:hypothetical protein
MYIHFSLPRVKRACRTTLLRLFVGFAKRGNSAEALLPEQRQQLFWKAWVSPAVGWITAPETKIQGDYL